MTKYLAAALAAVIVVGSLLLWGQQGHYKARQALAQVKVVATQRDAALGALEAVNRNLLRNQELTIARTLAADALLKAAQARARKLDEALKANPQWASAAVPDSVFDALPGGPDAPAPAAPNGAAGRLPGPTPPPRPN